MSLTMQTVKVMWRSLSDLVPRRNAEAQAAREAKLAAKKADQERVKSRKERFGGGAKGTPETEVQVAENKVLDERKRKRAERFGGGATGTPESEEVLAKKAQRAARFGSA